MFLRKKCKIIRFVDYFSVLYDKICQVMPMASRIKRNRGMVVSVVMEQYDKVIHTMLTVTIFARRGMARCSLKLRM